jgi:uncharacterized damage-inducible protein DinB
MNIHTLLSFFERDLNKLIAEIDLYENEENIWRVEKNIANSAGNLVLHLVGNLHTFIGKEIGKTNYVRDRELEFSQKNVPKKELIAGIKDTIGMVHSSLSVLSHEDLEKEYPLMKFPEVVTNEYLLIHLATHLAYHLGQVNYHRRLIDQ